MATPIQIANRRTNAVADVPELIFTAASSNTSGTLIDSFTAANNTAVNSSYKAYILPVGGTVEFPQRPFKIVVSGEVDLGSGLINQLIPPGGSLWVEQSTANSIYFTISGKQV